MPTLSKRQRAGKLNAMKSRRVEIMSSLVRMMMMMTLRSSLRPGRSQLVTLSGISGDIKSMTLDEIKSYMLFKAGTNRDGWFTNEDLMQQFTVRYIVLCIPCI